MRNLRFTAKKAAATTAALLGGALLSIGAGAAPAQAQAHTAAASHGCPSGYVCLYPNGSWNGDRPIYKWTTYGAHNISGQYGTKRFFNNQTGGAIARNCTGSNGTGCQGAQRAGTYADYNYTPYNSVLLARS
ncbi:MULTISPECIES: hypothetical protein [unclassified Streptomyces]|uniref:hypothetical protein n=1 Tax=unclassified Streptomyces TaxID=2593676 RepID=UPI00380F4482